MEAQVLWHKDVALMFHYPSLFMALTGCTALIPMLFEIQGADVRSHLLSSASASNLSTSGGFLLAYRPARRQV